MDIHIVSPDWDLKCIIIWSYYRLVNKVYRFVMITYYDVFGRMPSLQGNRKLNTFVVTK
jgi:hypothetical protein